MKFNNSKSFEKEQLGELTLFNFKTRCRDIVTKPVWYLWREHIYRWMELKEVPPNKHIQIDQLICDNDTKAI
jgi:hypothetical protein